MPTSANPTKAPGAAQAFVQWVDSRQQGLGKLDSDSAAKYASIWNVWVQALPADTPWHRASTQDVETWLREVRPSASARRNRASLSEGRASPVTQRRYWRVLRDVYAHAVDQQWAAENPCEQKMAVPRSEAMASMVLTPRMLDQVHQALVQDGAGQSWQAARDRCMKLLLLATAAKTGEIVQLRSDQVWSMAVGGASAYTVELQRAEPAESTRRIVVDDPGAVAAITAWRKTRQQVPGHPEWLFFSAKRENALRGDLRKPLTAKSVFTSCAATLEACLPPETLQVMLAHAGAECLRNSVIARWLATGMDISQVLHLSGLKDPRSLARLLSLMKGRAAA